MNKNNPYQNNSRIIKNFLRKPYTLIVAILYTIPFLLTVGAFALFVRQSLAGGYFGITRTALMFTFSLMSAVPPFSFFLMYFNNKKDDDNKEVFFRKPKLFLSIYSVINLTGYAMINIYLVYKLATNNEPEVLNSLWILNVAIVPISFAIILFYIAFLTVLKSIGTSTSSIYLSSKGSGFLFVISLVCCVVSLVISLLFSFFMMFSDFSLSLPANVGSLLTIIMLLSKSVTSSIMLVYSFIFLGVAIFAFAYRKYINKIVNSFITPFSMKPVENIDSLDKEDVSDSVVVGADNFEPQNPFFDTNVSEPEESFKTDTEIYISDRNAEKINEPVGDNVESDGIFGVENKPYNPELVADIEEKIEPATPSVPVIHTPITEKNANPNTTYKNADVIFDISSPNEKYKRQTPPKSNEPVIDNINDIAQLKPDATYKKPDIHVEKNAIEDIRDIQEQKAETTYKKPAIEYDDTVDDVSDLTEKDDSNYIKPEYQKFDENAINDVSDIARVFGENEKKETSETSKPVTYTSLNKSYNKNSFFGIPVSIEKAPFKSVSDSDFENFEKNNTEDTSQFCHHCGSKLIDDSVFCSKCGTRVMF